MKKLTFLFFTMILLSSVSLAQWVNQGAFPDTSLKGQMHGVAVDPAGKIWVANFGAESFQIPGDTATISTRLIRVYNPDGTPASFSPIWKLTVGGVTDTLRGSNSRGMRADHNGNILYVDGLQNMYRINYQTGEGMNKVALGLGTSPTAPAVDGQGNIYVAPVVNAGFPIKIFDADFNEIGVVDTIDISGFSRSVEVSSDGLKLYLPIYTLKYIKVYGRTDEFSPWDSVGTLMDGISCEAIAWNKATGELWAAGGSYNDLPDPLGSFPFTPNTFYSYNFNTNSITDSLKWVFTVPENPAERPRGIDFSPDGRTAYIGCFGGAGYPLVQKVFNTSISVRPEELGTVQTFELNQNYPNPFNPSTEISFSVVKDGMVTLKVYDILGREVAVLVNEELTNGKYSVTFDASKLSSGTYVYALSSNGYTVSKKMTVMK